MRDLGRVSYGAAAGAAAVALFVTAALLMPERPAFEASAVEQAAYFGGDRTRIQISCALFAAAAPFFVLFLATVAGLAREAGPAAAGIGAFAFACGAIVVALLTADVTTLAVAALRPENVAAVPELAAALRDFELLVMGMAAFLVSATLAAFAALSLRHAALWPRWLGGLALIASAAYLLRVGTLFTTDGPFAADGVLGVWVPVVAFMGWTLVASIALVRRSD